MHKGYDDLPPYEAVGYGHAAFHPRRRRFVRSLLRLALVAGVASAVWYLWQTPSRESSLLNTERLKHDYATCGRLRQEPEDPTGLGRGHSSRWVKSQKAVLIRNATVWTGEPSLNVSLGELHAGKGFAWIRADVLLEKGLISRVETSISDDALPDDYDPFDAEGRQLTSGIVDMHSHAGVDSLPELRGNSDTNELSNDVTPYVRSLDGFNPLDPQIQVIKSGGVTTSLILPGSGNNIGGEAFVVKHAVGKEDGRSELSIEDLLADPDGNWRYIKMACGENAKRIYGEPGRDFGPFSRLGEAWYFRHAFEEAAKLKNAQDDWCSTADRVGAENLDSYLPSDLKWETLSAVLRGQVLVNTHCYTVPDLETFIGLTNEFKFKIRAFHHAHSTYLVPELLKRAYGGTPPAAALFADNMYFKAESYVASEEAGRILYDEGITPVYVSDNPVINAQHVVFEAARAYKNGLPYHAALASVTSAPAALLGLGERVGKVKAGFDADIVVWDSDPLSVGAVWIDGTPQWKSPTNLSKPLTPPLNPIYRQRDQHAARVETTSEAHLILTGVSSVKLPNKTHVALNSPGRVVITNGSIVCAGECAEAFSSSNTTRIDLEDGHIAPALTAFGSLLGLSEISGEAITQDGALDESSFSRAIDGLALEGKNLEAAYSHGVTKAISAPRFGRRDAKGLSVGFRTGGIEHQHALTEGTVFAEEVALHYSLGPSVKQGKSTPSYSSAIGDLKAKLLSAISSSDIIKAEDLSVEDAALRKVAAGDLALVIGVHSADVIASLLRLKSEVEAANSAKETEPWKTKKLRFVAFGGAESWIVADELAAASVGVILAPLFSYATTWDQRRALTGAPLTNGTAIDVLHAAGVQVAIGVSGDARNLFLQAGIVQANSQGRINETEALGLVSSNIYEILGLEQDEAANLQDFVVFEGNPLTINSHVVAVSNGRGKVVLY